MDERYRQASACGARRSPPGPQDEPGGIDDLANALDRQKARSARIPLPDLARFAKLPPSVRAQAERVAWMTVSMGYQPQLTAAWFDCLRAYQSEAAFDRVFANSVFWVIT